MEAVFIKILNMSITSGWLVLAVTAARFLLKKAPKWISVLLWSLVGVRLVCPFSPESIFSLIPSAKTVPSEIAYMETPAIQSGVPAINSVVNPVLSESFSSEAFNSANPMQIMMFAASVIWLIGMGCMLVYFAVSYLCIRFKVREAVLYEKNVFICDRVSSPFILGIFFPKIYLPSRMNESDYAYVTAHENAHLERHDHLWKPIGFLLLTVYWFNPLLWLAYVLLCRDIEFACDERVIKEMGGEGKKAYSKALINCSIQRRTVSACPLAFGEVGIKGRIKSVLSYRKPTIWIIMAAVVLSAVLAVCFLTDPKLDVDEKLAVFIDCEIASAHQSESTEGRFSCLDWELIGKEKDGELTTVYLWTLYGEFNYDGAIVAEKLVHTPVMITVRQEKGEYRLVEYWEPGGDATLKDRFPSYLLSKAANEQAYYSKQLSRLETLANEHFAEQNAINADNYSGENFYLSDSTEFSFTASPVGYTEDALSVVLNNGFFDSKISMNSIQYYPSVKITDREQLFRLKEKIRDTFDFDLSYPASFNEVCKKYTDEYFENNMLLLVYTSSSNDTDRFFVEFAEKSGTELSVGIGITKFTRDLGGKPQSWIIAVNIPKSYNFVDIDEIHAFRTSIVYADETYDATNAIARYEFSDSSENIKPVITLFDNGRFTLTFSAYSSYIGFGEYQLKDGKLILNTDDSNVYCFNMTDGNAVFDAVTSTGKLWYSDIEDGSVFKLCQ